LKPQNRPAIVNHMKAKTAAVNGLNKQDTKYSTLIDDYLGRIKQLRTEMKRSNAEIHRLEISSRRKLAEIDAVLKAC